jgi:hypothetical protein
MDGNTMATGGNVDNNSIGATWVFVRNSGVWTQQGPKLVGSGYVGQSNQGYAVALKNNVLVIGGYADNDSIGATWVFKRTGTVWTQQGSKLVGSGYIGTDIEQGSAVSINDDETIFITGGGVDNDNVGAIWVFKYANGIWSQYLQKLVGSGYTNGPQFGYFTSDIAISGDGATIAFGGQSNDASIGGTWVFIGF